MEIIKRDWKHMYFVILFSFFSNRIVLYFHNSNNNGLIYSGVLQKSPVLLVLEDCSGVRRVL